MKKEKVVKGKSVKRDEKRDEKNVNMVNVEDISGCIVVYKDKKYAIDSVRVSVGATISTGNFETARFGFGVTIRPIQKDVSIDDMAEIGWDVCKSEISEQILNVRKKLKGSKVDEGID